MNVLCIGAAGFIGSHVVRLLIEQGHDVAVLHRGRTRADLPENVQRIYGSRDALADVQPEMERFRPDVVLDMIPYTKRHAREAVGAFRGLAQRIVVISSADVYRNYDGFRGRATALPDPVPLSENSPLRETRYPYRGAGLPFDWADDYDKVLVERLILGHSLLPSTIIRLPAVYGPGDKQHRLGTYLNRMREETPTLLIAEEQSEWRWTRGYVENVAAAIALAIIDDRAAGRVYNVGEEPAPTEREWIGEIGMAVGWTGKVIPVSADSLPENLRQSFDFRYELATDTTRIRQELSYSEPVGRDESLKRTVEWELSRAPESEPRDIGGAGSTE